MKKRKIAICLAVCATLAVAPTLAACSGDHYSKITFSAQDTSYVVTSQGGSAVGYGNYIYFINGTRGYDDTDGKNNVWDETVKGAVYRAELNGAKHYDAGDAYATFSPTLDTEKGLEFKYTEDTDYFDEPIEVVGVDKIAPKTAGTRGYANGGLFIYDNFIYFASPNNTKNSTGTVQTNRTDFFMMPLSGGAPTKLYTTSEGVDTSSSAYAFYKFDGTVYLVVAEGGTIVSVAVNTKKQKAADPVRFEVDATSVYFPVRDTYYTGISDDTVEDFIYFVRSVTDDDTQRSGTVIEAMRPNGSENFTVSANGQTETIEAVRDGVLFYRTTVSGKTVMAYNSLHDNLLEYSATYKAAQDALDADSKNRQFAGVFPSELSSSITSTYAFRPDTGANDVFYIGINGTTFNMYSTDGSVKLMYAGNGTAQFIKNGYLYYSGTSSDFFRIPVFETMSGYGMPTTLATGTTSGGISCDYVDGYFTYFGKVDDWANGYAYFYKVDGYEGLEPKFVGQRASFDIPTEDQIKEAKGETDDE